MENIKKIASELRLDIIKMCHESKSAHLGSCLSCVDILATAYWSDLQLSPATTNNPDRDYFILSKGHAAMALYATLAKKKFFDAEELKSYNKDGGRLAEHPPANILPGVDVATGSLGHGLPIGAGIALSKIKKQQNGRVFVLLSDGETNEGSVWEAAMFASGKSISNLCVIVDCNGWQATDRVSDVLNISMMKEKWSAFGWDAEEIDGHDINQIHKALLRQDTDSKKPRAIIASTVKGRGVSFMEDDNNWHYRSPSHEEVLMAEKELGLS